MLKPLYLTSCLLLTALTLSCRPKNGTVNPPPEPKPVLALATETAGTLEQGAAVAAEQQWLILTRATDREALTAVLDGETPLALIRADRLFLLIREAGPFSGRIRNGCRVLAVADLSPVLIPADGISRSSGLSGKRINTGALRSADAETGTLLLAGLGLTETDSYQAEGLSSGDAALALERGKLDALIWIGSPAELPPGLCRDFPPVTLPQDIAAPLYRANLWLRPLIVKTWNNPRLSVAPESPSAAIPWLVVASRTVTDQEARRMTRKLCRQKPERKEWSTGRSVLPLHPGAAGYLIPRTVTLE